MCERPMTRLRLHSIRTPLGGDARCSAVAACACTASGHATAVLPKRPMKSRRLLGFIFPAEIHLFKGITRSSSESYGPSRSKRGLMSLRVKTGSRACGGMSSCPGEWTSSGRLGMFEKCGPTGDKGSHPPVIPLSPALLRIRGQSSDRAPSAPHYWAVMVSLTFSTSALSAKGFGRKANCSPCGKLLSKASSA